MQHLLPVLEANTSLPSDGIEWTRPKRINGVSKFHIPISILTNAKHGREDANPHKLNIGM